MEQENGGLDFAVGKLPFPTAVFLSINSSKEVYLYFLLKMFVKLI